jgi:WD40 repeat protein
VLLWSTRDLALRAELDPGMTVGDLIFTDGDRTLVVAGGDGLRAFDVATGASRWIASWRFSKLQSVAASADGRALATGAHGTLFVWDARTGRRSSEIRLAEPSIAQAVAFSPDARHVASAWSDGHARIHLVGSARSHCDVDLRADQAREVVWSDDGASLFVATGDPNGGSIVSIDPGDCSVRSVLREPSRGWIEGLARGPAGQLGAVARERLLVVDPGASSVVETRSLGTRDLGEVAWCGAGGPIVAASDDGYVYVVAPGGAAP